MLTRHRARRSDKRDILTRCGRRGRVRRARAGDITFRCEDVGAVTLRAMELASILQRSKPHSLSVRTQIPTSRELSTVSKRRSSMWTPSPWGTSEVVPESHACCGALSEVRELLAKSPSGAAAAGEAVA